MHSRSPKGLAELQKQRLFECIATGRLYKLRLMLEDEDCEIDVNCFDENQLTPLMLACSLDDEKAKTRDSIIRILLKRGSDVNVADSNGMTVLANACKTDNIQIVRTLLNRASLDIDYNSKDENGDTPLMHAVRTGNPHLVRLLVNIMQKLGIDIDVRNKHDITPYLEAKILVLDDVVDVLKNLGHASESLQIFPLVFDQYKENKYLPSVSSLQPSFLHQNNHPDDYINKPASLNRKTKQPVSKPRPVKSAMQQRRIIEVQKPRRAILPKKDDIVADSDIHVFRARSKSETKQEDRTLHVHIKNAESEVEGSEKEDTSKTNNLKESNYNEYDIKEPNAADPESQDETQRVPQNLSKTPSQPQISISDENAIGRNAASATSEDPVVKSKNIWQSRISKKAPSWKRKLQLGEFNGTGSVEESRIDVKNLELCRESTISGGALRKILLEKPGTPSITRRCTSNLSVYFNDPVRMPKSRPTSAFNVLDASTDFEFFQRQILAEGPSKPKITYEEIFELCPDLKENSTRTWYSDLRWMLALRAHQNCATYLPAQPERFAFEYAPSDPRIEVESRMSRRISVSEVKRPTLKKRTTTLSPTAMRESKEWK